MRRSSTPTKRAPSTNCCNVSNKTLILIIISILLSIIGLALILQILFVNRTVNDLLKDAVSDRLYMNQKQQDKNTTNYKKWVANIYKDTAIEEFTYYLHNITNPNEVLNGAWPKLSEVGPFKYLRIENRVDPVFDSESCIVSYSYHFDFQFLEDQSYDINAMITIINPNILSVFYNSVYSDDLATKTTAQQLLTFILSGGDLFTTLEAGKLFTGFTTPWLEALLPGNQTNGSFYQILSTEMDIKTYTGDCKKNDAAEIISVDGSKRVDFWRTPEYINGSREVKVWPYNYVSKKHDLSVFSTLFKRKVNFTYEKEFTRKGVDLLRYRLSNTTLLNNDSYPLNNKYYQNGENGLLNFTMSSYPNPVFSFISLRNFHKADYYYEKYGKPTGLVKTPADREDDTDIYLDINRKTGVVFNVRFEIMSSILLYRPHSFSGLPSPFSNINSTDCYVGFYSLEIDIYAPDRIYKQFRRKVSIIKGVRLFSNYLGVAFGCSIIFSVILYWLLKYGYDSMVQNEEEEIEDSKSIEKEGLNINVE